MNIQTKAVLAGVFFGIWPLIMNKSGLNGFVSSALFSGIACLIILPFSASQWGSLHAISATSWMLVVVSAAIGAMGLIAFNGMLAQAKPQDVSTLFVLMVIAQTAVPAIYKIFLNGGELSMDKVYGFILAGIAAHLLIK